MMRDAREEDSRWNGDFVITRVFVFHAFIASARAFVSRDDDDVFLCSFPKSAHHTRPTPHSSTRMTTPRASTPSSSSRVARWREVSHRSHRSRRGVTRRVVARAEDERGDDARRVVVAFIDDANDDDDERGTTTVRTMSRARAMARALSSSTRGASYEVETRDAREGGTRADCAVTSSGRALADGTPTVSFGTSSSSSSRGEREDGEGGGPWTFWISTVGTTRSRKRPGVALTPETVGGGGAAAPTYPRGAREAIRERAERAFDGERHDFEVRRGKLVPCEADEEGAVAFDGVEELDAELDEEDDDVEPTTSTDESSSFVRVVLEDEPVCGFEAWEKVFTHAACVGLSMDALLDHLVKNAMHRTGARRATMPAADDAPSTSDPASSQRMRVYVLFGGSPSSGYTGRQLYLTLRNIPTIDATPVLVSRAPPPHHRLADALAWRLPYAWAVDPSQWAASDASAPRDPDLGRFSTPRRVRADLEKYLWISPSSDDAALAFDARPRASRLGALLSLAASEGAIIFNATRGAGPSFTDGSLQQLCVSSGVAYAGCGALASRVCADDVAASKALAHLRAEGIGCLNKRFVPSATLASQTMEESGWGGRARTERAKRLWLDIVGSLGGANATTRGVCVKPAMKRAGWTTRPMARLMDENDLFAYVQSVGGGSSASASAARNGYLFEPFFEVARVATTTTTTTSGATELVLDDSKSKSRWVEVLVTVFGEKPGSLVAFTPSVRVRARGGGETRFEMDGAETVLSARVSSDVRDRARRVADALQIEGFAAIAAFVNVDNGEMIVVDVDTVPPMTSASAAVFEQALAEDPPVDAETFCTRALSFALVRRFR